jgi:prevent-host-death family protein
MDTWKLQDAKARFSELVDRALANGPQLVTRHGNNAVVVVSYAHFHGSMDPAVSFKDFILASQGVSDLPVAREKHLPRANGFEVPA